VLGRSSLQAIASHRSSVVFVRLADRLGLRGRNQSRLRSGQGHQADIRAESIGAYVTSGDRLPNGCDSTGSLLRATHAAEAAQRMPGPSPGTLTLLTWPDALVRIAGPGPASFIQVGSDAKIRRRCHLIVTFHLEQIHEKFVELRGFEPLTSCMPSRCVAVGIGR